jgi:hypothetical protein
MTTCTQQSYTRFKQVVRGLILSHNLYEGYTAQVWRRYGADTAEPGLYYPILAAN